MPSIQDVADQINARLDQINTNTSNTAQNTADIHTVSQQIHAELQQTNNRLFSIENTLAAGFANVSQGLNALLTVQIAALQLLDHHRKQHDTIICELVNNNDLLCNIMRKLGRQVSLSEAMLESDLRVEGILERVYPGEVADYDRQLDLHLKIEECCPEEPERPEPCPKECDKPGFDGRIQLDLDWKPLPTPPRPKPEG